MVNKKSQIAVSRVFQMANLSYLEEVAEWELSLINEKKSFSRAFPSRSLAARIAAVDLSSQAMNTIGWGKKLS